MITKEKEKMIVRKYEYPHELKIIDMMLKQHEMKNLRECNRHFFDSHRVKILISYTTAITCEMYTADERELLHTISHNLSFIVKSGG